MGANLSFHYCYRIPYQISRIRILSKLVVILLGAFVLCFICSCDSNSFDERNSGFEEATFQADDSPKYGNITLEFEEEFVLGEDPDGGDFVSRYDIEVDSKERSMSSTAP